MTYKILLVEDEKWVRTAIRKVIEKTGLPVAVVQEASNGIEASDWMAEGKADLVLTDIRMPRMDGLALVKEMKESGYPAEAVIVSGHDDFTYAQQAIRSGAIDYLLKPVEAAELERCIGGWIRRKERQAKEREPDIPEVEPQELSPVDRVIRHIDTNYNDRGYFCRPKTECQRGAASC